MITIVVLIVFLSIIALIVILLHFSLVIYLHVGENGFDIKAKYLGFMLYPRPPKKRRKKRKSEKNTDEQAEDTANDSDFYEDDLESELDELPDDSNPEPAKSLADEKESSAELTEKITEETPENDVGQAAEEAEAPKAEKKKPKKAKAEKKQKSGNKSKIRELKEKYEKIKPYIPMGWKYLKKLLKAIRIRFDDVIITVGREDAHEAAIYYGIIQGTVANTLSLLSEIFTARVKRLDVNCLFNENHISGKADISVRARPSTLIAIAFCIAVNFLIIFLKNRKKSKKNKNNDKNESADKSERTAA